LNKDNKHKLSKKKQYGSVDACIQSDLAASFLKEKDFLPYGIEIGIIEDKTLGSYLCLIM